MKPEEAEDTNKIGLDDIKNLYQMVFELQDRVTALEYPLESDAVASGREKVAGSEGAP
jgi:hypothetical protein